MAQARLYIREGTHNDLVQWVEILSALFQDHYIGGTSITRKEDFLQEQRDRQDEVGTLRVIRFQRSGLVRGDVNDLLFRGGQNGKLSRPWNSNDDSKGLPWDNGFVYVRSHYR